MPLSELGEALWASGWIYAGVSLFIVMPKKGIYRGNDTGDFREVEADTDCRSTDSA